MSIHNHPNPDSTVAPPGGLSIVLYCAWFRPILGRDVVVDLLVGLERRGHRIACVIGPGGDPLATSCATRGWQFVEALGDFKLPSHIWKKRLEEDHVYRERLTDWLGPVKECKADLGILYFSTWIPQVMIDACPQGFINYHPAPLPDYKGFLPEDFAILHGLQQFGSTVHKVEADIDTGPILFRCPPAPVGHWDTPDSLMQSIAEYGLPGILDAVDLLARGKAVWEIQDTSQAFDAGYEAIYPYSTVDWAKDSHLDLHRKFQVFRGQAHRIVLKAAWGNKVWEILDWELHRGSHPALPGTVLGHISGHQASVIIRTSEGICIVWDYNAYAKAADTHPFMDVRRMEDIETISAGYRAPHLNGPLIESMLPEFRSI